jgi:hypothetical protein
MSADDRNGPYLEAVRRGFMVARELGQGCGPVHLLVGVAEGDGPAAAALHPGQGRSLRAIVAGEGAARAAGGYVQMQSQSGALALAKSRGERVSPEHLLIALIDQATAPVLDALTAAGLDPAAVRQAAAAAIGAPGLPPIHLPPLTPAGTADRPPLPVADLDPRAWAALIGKVHGPAGREALLHLERSEAWRLADRLGLDEDQRYSLLSQHAGAVAAQVDQARPEFERDRVRARAEMLARRQQRLRRRGARAFLYRNVLAGWAAWFSNRRVGLRDRWFRLRTMSAYRGAPQP